MEPTGEIFQRAFENHKTGKLADAQTGYQKVLAAEPDHPSALHLLGLIKFDTGNIKDAVPLVQKSVELAPDEFQWHLNYGKILSKAGDKNKAIFEYQQALSIKPDSREAKISLGNLYCETFRFNEALSVFFGILADNPTDDFAKERYDEILKEMRKELEPSNFFVMPTSKVDAVSELAFLADSLYRIGYYDSAHYYVFLGLNEMLKGKAPSVSLSPLLDSWGVTTPGAFFASMWVKLHALSMCYVANNDDTEKILNYWCNQEPKNPEPFLRLGLVWFLNATKKNQTVPEKAREAVQTAHRLMNNKRSALALSILESENRLDEVIVPYDEGHLFVYPDIKNITTYTMLEQGDWFEDTIHLFRSLIKPGDNILDLGANVGVYSLSAARRAGDMGKVISVEPCKKTFSYLYNSAKQFKNLRAINCALSNARGKGILEQSEGPELMRLVENDPRGEVVKVTTVDDLTSQEKLGHVDIIKMDVEGFEMQVLEGAARTLANSNPIIFYEVSETGLDLADRFQTLGFDSYYYCAPRNALRKYQKGDVFDSFLLNLIAIRKNSLARFSDIVTIDN